jgi:M6 family metalloprotease-like protein
MLMWPPTLADLGHGSMTQLGFAATGGRPLLIILGEYSNFEAFSKYHPLSYYQALGFGNPTPPFETRDPVNPGSLTEYFREVSSGRFWFNQVGLYGPVALGQYDAHTDPGPQSRGATIISKVADAAPQLFTPQDVNGDRTVNYNELCVVIAENIPDSEPANTNNNPVTYKVQLPGPLPVSFNETIQVHVAGVGPQTPFYQVAHELSHSLGTIDMYYAPNNYNTQLTLMGAYSFLADDQVPVHLDMWHKMQLGWAEPRIFRMSDTGSATVVEGAAGAVVLYDDAHGANEYFIIERRRHNTPGLNYDSGVAGDGILIWRVAKQGATTVILHQGSPTMIPGNNAVWSPGQQTPTLIWTDGSPANCYLTLTAQVDGSINVAWGDQLTRPSSLHLELFYGGNGLTLVDSGLPSVGVFYGVLLDGTLDWNCYQGSGQQVGDPQSAQAWAANSGNLIGRGWQGMKKILGCGDGVIMAVDPDGYLRWYKYLGQGQSDVAGSQQNWDLNSGNRIGRGWNFKDMFVLPAEGNEDVVQLFGITDEGDLRWFGYEGDGTADPAFAAGWKPNSGNSVGRGWQNFRHVFGAGSVIYAVTEDGVLHWYCYTGGGVSSPSGSIGWDPNSGNPINHGWQDFQHVFGGMLNVGHLLLGVDTNNNLRWYNYSGIGESDVTGQQGWAPRSGNIIGTSW